MKNLIINNRTKSFAWRTGMMVLAYTLSVIADNLGILALDPAVVTIAGLVLGEVSKYINGLISSK